ncbi:MAG: hypothetical protein K6F50_10160 [Kiritimatiellae bacterium]|nr:hypothetical protein [Kiritimatiellia bacterium]
MEAVKRPLQLLEIEKELSGPDRRDALRRHDAVLAGLEKRIADAMDAGLSPEEYSKTERLREANVLARKLLRLAVREADEP